MEPLNAAALTFLIVAGSMLLTAAVALRVWSGVRRDRLAPREADPERLSLLRWDSARAGWQRLIEPLGRFVAPRNLAELTSNRQQLMWAGFHDPRAVMLFAGARLTLGVALLVAYPLAGVVLQRVLSNTLITSIVLGIVGYSLLPRIWLRRRIAARQENIVNMLPEMLDLLMVCVDSGMSFDSALARVAEQPEVRRSPLHQEVRQMNLEIRAGRPRHEALRALADRCGVRDVSAMVSVFIQTDRLGTSISTALRVYADTARTKRRHRAEERAYLAPVKMIFPMVIFLMPAFMLVALAPSFISVLASLRALAK